MKFALGFIVALLIIALGLGVLWGLDRFGIVNSKNLILQGISYYPGLKDLSAAYDLGQKQSAVLEQRVKELQNLAQKLKMEQSKLHRERTAFDETKLNWEKQHLLPANPTLPAVQAAAPAQSPPQGSKGPTKEEEAKLKAYLATIGAMKPEMAARVLQKLPENITFQILEQTPDRNVTKIMEFMPPEYVAALTRDRVSKTR